MEKFDRNNFDEIIRSEFERGLKGEGAAQFQKIEWVDFFHYSEDIFDPEKNVNPELIHDRTIELKFLAKLVGNQKANGMFYHLALVGPKGYGKRTLLLGLHLALKRMNIASGFILDISEHLNLETGEDFDDKLHNTKEFHDANYVFFMNCQYSVTLEKWIETAVTSRKLVITSWRPFHYNLGRRKFNQISRGSLPNKEIFLREMKPEDLVQIVESRVRAYGPEESPIQTPEIALAAEKSLGNIRTLLYFIKNAHLIAMLSSHEIVERGDMVRAIEEVGAGIEPLKLSEKEIKLLLYILDQYRSGEQVTPASTAQHFEWDLPLTWRYFKRLVIKKILIKEGTQKGAHYRLNEGPLALGEDYFMKNYLQNNVKIDPGD